MFRMLIPITLIIRVCEVATRNEYEQGSWDTSSSSHSPCVTKFHNIALFKMITASSSCGLAQPIEMCSIYGCDTCDFNREALSHPPRFLNDFNHDRSRTTCWRSDLLVENSTEVIVLNLSLSKLYEVSYMSVQTCDSPLRLRAISVEISIDFGESWNVLGYYSKDCRKVKENKSEQCFAWVENPIFNRISVSFNRQDKESVVEATNMKFSLMPKMSTVYHNSSNYISLSDLSVGGRCKCNGHASTCRKDRQSGNYRCICVHHTTGQDCEHCEPMYQDAPWRPATDSSSSACVACKCSNHATVCTFSMIRYIATNNRTGGICQNCSDNTEGVACDKCKSGYTRNHQYAISDKSACTACQCHKIGSQTETCHPATGQCLCKYGVIGLKCDRCAQGFYQTRSHDVPCKSQIVNVTHREVISPRSYDGRYRQRYCRDICIPSSTFTMAEFCKSNFVFTVKFKKLHIHNRNHNVVVQVQKSLRDNPQAVKMRYVLLHLNNLQQCKKCLLRHWNRSFLLLTNEIRIVRGPHRRFAADANFKYADGKCN